MSLSNNGKFNIEIMDPLQFHSSVEGSCGDKLSPTKSASEKKASKIEDFSEFLEDGIGTELKSLLENGNSKNGKVGGIFNTLKPPMQEGFLKIRNPCLYIFPAGHGDSAFFAVNGFNMLVNGGASTKPWFWKLIQHVDRVDSILATHLGSDNLPGLNSLLLRKLQERQVKLPMDNTTPEYQELRRCLISPDLGPLFINAPGKFLESINKASSVSSPTANGKMNGSSSPPESAKEDSTKHPVLKTVDIVKDTMRLSKALNMEIVPLIRKSAPQQEPITLFSKVGLGRLDMYVISPLEGSKEFSYVNEKWGCNGKTTTPTGKTGVVNSEGHEGDSSVTNMSSICCLLVWHPSNPNERIVRVLFPGNSTQTKIFEGLESLKNLPFLKTQFVTKNTLNKQKHTVKTNGTHPPQRGTRPASSTTATHKKPSTTGPKKTAVQSTGPPGKREATNGSSHPADKRSKIDKPGPSKPRSTTAPTGGPAKTTTTKEKVQQKSGRADGDKTQSTSKSSSASSLKKSATSKSAGVSSVAHAKQESKRPSTSRPLSTKPRPQAIQKVQEKVTKKSQSLTPTKSKVEPRKSPSKAGTRPSSSKTGAKKSPEKAKSSSAKVTTKAGNDKSTKKSKAEPVAIAITPPEDLTPEFAPVTVDEKSAEPLSTTSEEPTNSSLSDRHSPEGEDVPSAIYAESPVVIVEEKDAEKPDLADKNEPEKEDTGFIIMNKPQISEGSDFISENGSSVDAPQKQESLENQLKLEEADLISSDASTPTPVQPSNDEKVVSFVDAEEDKEEVAASGAHHAALGRLPTPFHSLQESSGTTENSPLSESEAEICAPVEIEKDFALKNEDDSEQEAQVQRDVIHSDAAEEEKDSKIVDIEGDFPAAELSKDLGSDVHNSFNSSLEGSYELYPTGRSPPPASDRQETIAETISDFKHDETPAVQQFEDTSPNLDTQQQQVDLMEDQTMSTEAPDPRFSISSTSTGSRLARMDSPFSPSEMGVLAASDQQPRPDPTQIISPKHGLTSVRTEDDISSICGPTGDFSISTDAALSSSNLLILSSATSGAVIPVSESANELPGTDAFGEHLADPVDSQMKEGSQNEQLLIEIGDDKVPDDIDGEDKQEYDGGVVREEQQTPDEQGLDNYPQHAWDDDKMDKKDEEFDLHAHSHDNVNLQEDIQQKEEENYVEDDQVLDNMKYQGEDVENELPYEGDSNINDNERGGLVYQEDEDRMQLTGSLASSAQDQGPDGDYSESASLTETGATPDVEHPPVGFDYDGPDVKEYEQVQGDIISKSDLSLSSPEGNFPLHGGDTLNLLELNGNTRAKLEEGNFEAISTYPETPEDDPISVDDKPEPATSPLKYHQAYIDPTAPLADFEDGQEDSGILKPEDNNTLLDVYAPPFVPKTSVPVDQSPTHGTEADWGIGEKIPANGDFVATSPTATVASMNPFMADLMMSVTSENLDVDTSQDSRLPPVRGPDPCAAQDPKLTKVNPKKTGAGTSRKVTTSAPIFLDLAYVPSHANKNSVGIDFFKRIRARYYVISGNDQSRDEPSNEVLNHLLEGKRSWFTDPGPQTTDHDDTNITVIPTHDTNTVREWYQQNFKDLESCNIHMVASGSKVLMQDESIEACKIEF